MSSATSRLSRIRPEKSPGSGPRSAAADRHDVPDMHPWRAAAGDRPKGWTRDAPHPRDGGVRRHDRRDPVRRLPDAGLLLGAAAPDIWRFDEGTEMKPGKAILSCDRCVTIRSGARIIAPYRSM